MENWLRVGDRIAPDWKESTMRILTSVTAAFALLSSLTPAHASDADFKLVNKTTITIAQVYVSPAGTADWGSDIMGPDQIPDGGSVNIIFAHGSACLFDIKIVYPNGFPAEFGGVDLCQYNTITLQDGGGGTTRAVGE